MANIFKVSFAKRGVGFYATCAACLLGIVSLVLFFVYHQVTATKYFNVEVIIFLALGIAVSALDMSLAKDQPVTTILETVFYSLAFAFYLDERIVAIEENLNGIIMWETEAAINALGFTIVSLLLVLVAAAAGMVASIAKKDPEA